MSRGPYLFKQLDLERAIRAAQKMGLTVSGIKMQKDGLPVIVVGPPDQDIAKVERSGDSGVAYWDKVIQELEGQADVEPEIAVR